MSNAGRCDSTDRKPLVSLAVVRQHHQQHIRRDSATAATGFPLAKPVKPQKPPGASLGRGCARDLRLLVVMLAAKKGKQSKKQR